MIIGKSRAELKAQALQQLEGNWGTAVGACLIFSVITMILNSTGQIDSSYSNVGTLLSLFSSLLYHG